MHKSGRHRTSPARRVSMIMVGALVLLGGLVFLLLKPDSATRNRQGNLVLFCAAAVRLPMEQICMEFERECGVHVDVQYGGSNTLLSQLQVSRAADLYLAADDSYLEIAREKGFIAETFRIATMQPVVVVPKGNPGAIHGFEDLLRSGLRVALGNPQQAAIGRVTMNVLSAGGLWDALEAQVTAHGVFTPTVQDVANAVVIGSVDAGIVWDAAAAQYDELEAVALPELKNAAGQIMIGVTRASSAPDAALRFARFVAASDRGLTTFGQMGYTTVEGEPWDPSMRASLPEEDAPP